MSAATAIAVAMLIGLLAGCLAPSTTTSPNDQALLAGPPDGGLNPSGACDIPANGAFSVDSVQAAQAMNLGDRITVSVPVSSSTFSGDLAITIVDDELQGADPSRQVSFALQTQNLHLNPGDHATVTVQVSSTTMTPEVNTHFHVELDEMNSPNCRFAITEVPFQVKPVMNIYLTGEASPPTWSVAPGTTLKFASHPNGVTVNFVNLSLTKSHIIHGSGAIPHESSPGMSPATAAGPSPNGIYSVKVAPSPASFAAVVYTHNEESGAAGRTLIFNTPSPSFAYIQNNILNGKCVSCHGVNGDLKTYAGVLGFVRPADPANSLLYTETSSGDMPQGGPKLSAVDLQAISDWIKMGAPQN